MPTPNTSDAMKRYKAGKAGFTDKAHLKAKGLIPRADGTKRKSAKYEAKSNQEKIAIDTVKKADNQIIKNTIDRESLWMAQTPQTFKKEKLLSAIKISSQLNITDESMLMEEANFKIKLIEGDQSNFKITNKIDWELAKVIVRGE